MLEPPAHASQTAGTPAAYRSTVDERVHNLLGADPSYTLVELADRAGASIELAREFWRAMGFANVDDGDPVFTDGDVMALRQISTALENGEITKSTAISLLRAQSHTMDRLVLWQTEALIEGLAEQHELDDVSARLMYLDQCDQYTDLLADQLAYAWRRNFAALLQRTEAEVAHTGKVEAASHEMPLKRAVGFVDMVAYTRRSIDMGSRALAELVQTFEYTSRDVITTLGGRVVKTIGDAILFVADDLTTGAEVAIELVDALKAEQAMLPVRASLVYGGVVSRHGDVFGSTVNLASRLADQANPGTVIVDETTSDLLMSLDVERRYQLTHRADTELDGLGRVRPVELQRRSGVRS